MILTIDLVTTTIFLIVHCVWMLRSRCDYFKRRGIPGPPPIPFFGHYRTLWSHRNVSEQLRQWSAQYGSIYGLLEGTRPISTLELMSSAIHECVDSLMNKLKTTHENAEQFNIYEIYGRLAMDVIYRCAFGVNANLQEDINNMMMHKCKLAVDDNPERLPITKLGNLMPFLIPKLHYVMIGQMWLGAFIRSMGSVWILPKLEELPALWILNYVRATITTRRQTKHDGKGHQSDLLQLMLDAVASDHNKVKNDLDSRSKTLHEEEVDANMLLFMTAAYDSVSTTLASCTYILATKSDIQDKLRAEINEQTYNNEENDNQFDGDTVMTRSYMEIFLREVLRMYPVATAATKRECTTTTIINDHQIEKGAVIQPDILSIHYDRELWGPEDPNLFIPERHRTRRHPMAYMPFGAGPRSCVGMRFAFLELKICLTQLLQHYTILPGEDIEEGFKHHETFIIQPDAVYIKLEKR